MKDIFSADLAEPLFRFAQNPDIFDDLCEKCEKENLSIAEYVERFKRSEFIEFLKKEGYREYAE